LTRSGAARRGRRPLAAVRVEARAKLNLGLAVGPKRADGFHDLATIFQSVSLADTLIARRRPRGFSLQVRFEDAALRSGALARGASGGRARAAVPAGRGNLVLVAARAFARATGIRGGARFELVKRIPAGAGLGGGSADAAAALAALAALYRVRWTSGQWEVVAGEIGSDVPFAMRGGTALGLGRGERLKRIALARPFHALLAVPGWRVSTTLAYRKLDHNKYALTGWAAKLRFAQNLGRKSVSASRAILLGNSFESVLGRRERDFLSLRSRLEAAGLRRIRMTGSGSALFGIIPSRVSALAVASRFAGPEALYEVKSERAGLRLHRI